jgi:L-alanine-DL-glutamate epimerase-like enolase superfamily enzyme
MADLLVSQALYRRRRDRLPHNFYGHLASVISAHFCAAVPNFRIMEIDIDGVPWRDEIVSVPPVIENGDFIVPKGPGWGIEVNEAGLRAHPAKQRG